MAHWIITNHGNYNIYKCSKCGAEWVDNTEWTSGISSWTHCNNCGDIIKDIENEYRSCLVHRPENSGVLNTYDLRKIYGDEYPNKETEEKIDPKELAELGKHVADGFAAGLKSGGFVMMSRKDYDAIVEDFDICIKERDKALSILDKELREVKEERDQYFDILKKIEIHKYNGKIVKNSILVDEFDNPADLTKMVKVTFKVEV